MPDVQSIFIETDKMLTDLGLSDQEAHIASVMSARIALTAGAAMAPYLSAIGTGRTMLVMQAALAINMKMAAFTETKECEGGPRA